jgi:putative phosphoribosyl transferase
MEAVAEDALLDNYSGDITIIDRNRTKKYGVEGAEIQAITLQVRFAIAAKEKAELRWCESCYRHYRPMKILAKQQIKKSAIYLIGKVAKIMQGLVKEICK